jgi:hypothetical protein
MPRACRCWWTAARAPSHARGRPGHRLRLLRGHRATSSTAPPGSGAIFIRPTAGGDAPLHGRRRHDPRGLARGGELRRPAHEVRGRHPGHRPDHRLRRRARLPQDARDGEHRRARAHAARLRARQARGPQLAPAPGHQRGQGRDLLLHHGGAHAHDVSTVLDRRGIAVRAGTHCAMPLLQHLGSARPAAPPSASTTPPRRWTRW